MIERITKERARPLTVNGTEVYLGSSIGVAKYPRDGTDANTLIECAAMYQAKQRGRNDVRYYKAPQKDCVVINGDFGNVDGERLSQQS